MRTRMKALLCLGTLLGLGAMTGRIAQAASTGTAEVDFLVTYSGNLCVALDANQAYSTYTLTSAGNNAFTGPASSITVKSSDLSGLSCGIIERWELDVSTIAGGGNWQLNNTTGTAYADNATGCVANCPAANQYAFQALFVSSNTGAGTYGTVGAGTAACPALSSSTWDTVMDTVPAHPGFVGVTGFGVYLAAQYASPNILSGTSGKPDFSQVGGLSNDGDMYPVNTAGQPSGVGQRGLCVRMTMPSSTSGAGLSQQTIQLEVTAIGG